MTQQAQAIEALAADRDALLKIGAGLAESEWESESGCPGWSVQSVVAHLGALYAMVVDPSTLPDVTGLPTERAADVFVEQRRSWTAARVLADYESVSTAALAAAVRRAPPRTGPRLGRGRTPAAERTGVGGPPSRRGDRSLRAGGPPPPTRPR
jgi:uncharacterized protein (TIGR03083 family)